MLLNSLEMLMIVCFGLSWPISIYRSYTSRTAKGKSLFFEVFLWIGYIFGITKEFIVFRGGSSQPFVFYIGWFFYCLNLIEISVDIGLFFRNTALDRARDSAVAVEIIEETVEESADGSSEF